MFISMHKTNSSCRCPPEFSMNHLPNLQDQGSNKYDSNWKTEEWSGEEECKICTAQTNNHKIISCVGKVNS